MTKATKQLGGGAKDKYFRELFAAIPGLDDALSKKLVELTKLEVSQVRIRQPLGDERRRVLGAVAAKADAAKASASATAAAQTAPAQPAKGAAEAPTPAAAAFDPFAFTAVVILKRQGADALAKRLAEIAEPANLRLLADKQHLGVPADANDAATLRDAILKSAQARIDDRRAAAS